LAAKILVKSARNAEKAGNPALKSSSYWEKTMELTRRHALAGGAALAASPLLPSVAAKAAAPLAEKQAPSFYRYKVGDAQVNAISDGVNTFPLPDALVLNAKKEEVSAALEKAFLPKDKMSVHYSPLVINTGGKLVVVDTGNGPGAFASSKGNIGQFATNMAAAGFDAKAVDVVVISHFHGDHINGLLTADNVLAFPNAEVLVPAAEWKYFMDDGEMSRQTTERMQGGFKNVRRVFEAGLNKKVTPYEWGKDVAPGLLAVSSVGHTPGHTSFVLSSGSEKVFIQSDVTNHPSLFVANPGWHLTFDQDPAVAEATRRKVYDMLVADKMRVQGFHYPFPANGFVEKDGNGYRLVPAPWSPVI
jgi:glyoxylase-like metal-dependent hydrolase (beta-lactamase superfamily II)